MPNCIVPLQAGNWAWPHCGGPQGGGLWGLPSPLHALPAAAVGDSGDVGPGSKVMEAPGLGAGPTQPCNGGRGAVGCLGMQGTWDVGRRGPTAATAAPTAAPAATAGVSLLQLL